MEPSSAAMPVSGDHIHWSATAKRLVFILVFGMRRVGTELLTALTLMGPEFLCHHDKKYIGSRGHASGRHEACHVLPAQAGLQAPSAPPCNISIGE